MKKVIQVLVAVMAIVILANCNGKKSPESVAENFLQHLNKKEYAEAKKLGTQATIEMINMLEQFPATDVPAAEEVIIEEMKCTEEADKAKCTYKENGEPAEINLVKEEGAWKVDMPKEMPAEDLTLDEPIMEEPIAEDTIIEEPTTEVVE